MTHLTDHQIGRITSDFDTGTVACARCGATVTALPDQDGDSSPWRNNSGPDRVTLCGPCGRDPFATGSRPDHAAELRRAAELAHEALGLAWAAESRPAATRSLDRPRRAGLVDFRHLSFSNQPGVLDELAAV